MKLKAQIGAFLALTAGLLAFASIAVAAGPQTSFRDANERAGALSSAQASIPTYADAHARSQVGQALSPNDAVAYFEAAERAAAGVARVNAGQPIGHVDEFTGTKLAVGSSHVSTGVSVDDGFDWSAAAIGASTTLMLALLTGASLILTRRSRGRFATH
jgi:hypothetical protein